MKGLSPEPLTRTRLAVGATVPGDRLYAIENGPSGFDPAAPAYQPKQRFLMLMRNERLVVSRESLLDDVWGYAPFAETNTVDVFVSNLRRKLEAEGEPRMLHTVRGAGYVLRAA